MNPKVHPLLNGWWKVTLCLFIQKDPTKGNAVGDYRLIACLDLLWKLLTGIITDELYEHPENQELLPEEQKGCRLHMARKTSFS